MCPRRPGLRGHFEEAAARSLDARPACLCFRHGQVLAEDLASKNDPLRRRLWNLRIHHRLVRQSDLWLVICPITHPNTALPAQRLLSRGWALHPGKAVQQQTMLGSSPRWTREFGLVKFQTLSLAIDSTADRSFCNRCSTNSCQGCAIRRTPGQAIPQPFPTAPSNRFGRWRGRRSVEFPLGFPSTARRRDQLLMHRSYGLNSRLRQVEKPVSDKGSRPCSRMPLQSEQTPRPQRFSPVNVSHCNG